MTHFFSKKPRALLLVAVVLASVTALYFLISAETTIWHAVPSPTAMVIELNSPNRLERMNKQLGDAGWKGFFQTKMFKTYGEDAALIRDLFAGSASLKNAFEKGRLLGAYSLNDADSLHGLFVLQPGEDFNLESALRSNGKTQKYFPATFHQHTLYTVWFSREERMVVCQIDQLLLFSRFSYLLEESIVQLEDKSSWWANRKFTHELNPDAPFRLFVQPESLAAALKSKVNPDLSALPERWRDNMEWAGLAWDGVRVNVLAETKGFLASMAGWGSAPPADIFNVAPDHSALLAWAGYKKIQVFSEAMAEETSADFNAYVLPWLGHGVGFVLTEPRSPGLREDQLFFLSVKDSAMAMQRLRAYGQREGTLQEDSYQTFEVLEFLSPSVIAPVLQGRKGFENPVCTRMGDFVVFAATRSALEVCIDKYIVSQTLVNTPDCIQLLAQLQQEGNGMLIFNAQYINLLSQNFLNNNAHGRIKEDINRFTQTGFFGAVLNAPEPGKLALQWAVQAPGVASSQTGILWKTPLQNDVLAAPSLIRCESGAYILAQDVQHQLYCLEEGGNIRWRRQLEGPLLSAVQNVGSNDKAGVLFAFNTSGHLWVVDEKGQDLGRFPIELRSPATNGVLAVDFDKNLKFNYFVACANGNLYGFDHTGTALPGWNPNGGAGTVLHPVRHFQREGKDFLVALSTAGKLQVYGRNGQARFPAVALSGRFSSPPQVDNPTRGARIVCFNTLGKAFVCNTEGSVFSLQLGKGNTRSLGVLAPLSGDERKEYAVLQGNKLQVSGYEGSTLKTTFSLTLPAAQDSLFEIDGNRLGMLQREKRQILLLDSQGKIHPDFPLAGTSPFVVYPLRPGSRESLLIVGNSKQLYAYSIR